MAVSIWGLLDNSSGFTLQGGSNTSVTVAGPWQHSQTTISDIATITSSKNVFGFVDGENRAKYFYSSNSNSVNLPTISAVPNAVPFGAIPLGSSGTSFVFCVIGTNTNATTYQGGMLYFALTPAAGSPDGGSPNQYSLDPYGLLLVDSASTEWV